MKQSYMMLAVALVAGSAFAQWRPRAEPPPTPFTPAKLTPVSAAEFPELNIRNPETSIFLAAQYGTAKTDVVYFYLDSTRVGEVRDLVQAYAPGEGGLRPLGASRGSAAQLPGRGGETIRGREFRFRGLESLVGDAKFKTDLVLSSGFRQPDGLHLGAVVSMESPKGRAAYRTGVTLVEFVSMTAEGIKPVAVVNMPRFNVGAARFEPSRLNASLQLGSLPMVPGNGMGREIRVSLTETDGKRSAQQLRVQWREKDYIGAFTGESLANVAGRFRPGTTYDVSGELDLGPVFGVLTSESKFVMPEKN
ncbi:MAG TPA: hypothetical protein PKE12_12320 [Kiritimatiellia bacterium]|nr:hypothetical protein [Kiritimatiellia bacterium]